VCENAVLRSIKNEANDYPVACGDYCFIGPHATLLGCRVEPHSYIATTATILHGATVRSGAIVAVGALVHAKTVVPEGFFVPPHTTAIGDPVRLFAPDLTSAVVDAIKSLEFAKTAFDIDTDPKDRSSTMKAITRARSKEFAEHRDDEIR
jgi:carbonic anhydrase/acetyltransferase-like protein (isoleucine patch superfamily)